MRLGQHAALAQSVERLPRNEKVDSSILSSGSLTHSSVLILLICFYSLDYLYESMREWRNGRRAGFRFLCLTTCGFKSHLAHEIFRLLSNSVINAYSVINNAFNSGKSARKALPLCEIAFFSS